MNDNIQKDLVLSANEYAYVLDATKGFISCLVGPTKMSLSQSDSLVRFNSTTKRFEPTTYDKAIQLLSIVPENWYCILKNPAADNKHPTPGTSNVLPDKLEIGKKINITGPTSFALYPGQMAKVIRGHALRTNQYLLARVYEANSASNSIGEIRDAEGNIITNKQNYVNGQILVIKGTEVSFYIPPTGIEVIPLQNNDKNGYIRDAVTLERLEYCILKDENGSKRYVHGPSVVFPEPTETFITSPKGGFVFRAVELSPISGIYVKVIAEYKDGDVVHPVGEELFITGNEQMIYYPRPEHAIITYDNKMMHHAIAIPEGEGRYIMDRLKGVIKTVKGPLMYLPDPRYEVVVKRKLSAHQCELMYPGNYTALAYNEALNEKSVENSLKTVSIDEFVAYSTSNSMNDTLANLEAKANISRGTSYTKPRTITLDTKYEGVVSVDVWTGYAINVISKNGNREVICGPKTVMLDYDQTLEELSLSTGTPKTTDTLLPTVFLRYENNKVSDIVRVETKDFVKCSVKVSYCVDFLKEYKDKWFNIDNYVKFLCDRQRSLMMHEVKNYTIEEFYQNYVDIIRNIALNGSDNEAKPKGRLFEENGMIVFDCEVLNLDIAADVSKMLLEHQRDMVKRSLELSSADKRVKVAEQLAIAQNKEYEVQTQQIQYKMALKHQTEIRSAEIENELERMKEAERMAEKQAEKDLQSVLDAIADAERSRRQKLVDQDLANQKAKDDLEKAKQEAYANTVSKIMSAISPDLVAALTSNANTSMVNALTQAVSPYALADSEESISDVVNKLTRGLPLESAIKSFNK